MLKGILRNSPLAVLLAVVGCGGDGVVDPTGGMMPGPSVTLTQLQNNIFTPRCALPGGCHTGPVPPQGLNLSEGQAFSNLVGVRSTELPNFFRVEPGNPDDSYLVMKVSGDPRIVFSQMPLIGFPLTADEIQDIREWILDGALDN